MVILWPLAALVALYASAYAVDRVRGVQPEWTPVSDVRTFLADKEADDAPWWADLLGAVFAIGLFVRSGCHVYSALIAGADPHVADNDVTLVNTVLALRQDSRADLGARILSLFAGVEAWLMFDPQSLGAMIDGPATVQVAVPAFVAANIAVLLADPLLFAVYRLRTRRNTSETDTMTHDSADDSRIAMTTDGGRSRGEH
jgi:hypothetical protein